MPTNSQYPPVLLQEAAQFDPRVIARLRAMQGMVGADHVLSPSLGALDTEIQSGQPGRLSEQDYFAAAQGNVDARARIAGFQAGRDKAAEHLMKGLDEAEFERFRAKRRQSASQEAPTMIGGALDMRQQLLNSLKQ